MRKPAMGLIVFAFSLPLFIRLANQTVKWIAGAEGRLAAIAVETIRPLGPMPKVWSGLAQGGINDSNFLVKEQDIVSGLNPEYIRIDHIYDGFGVINRGSTGLTYDWSRLDQVVVNIQTVGAKPFLSLSYMPQALANKDILSEPGNWKEWSELIKATVEHYSGTLGIENVYYEVWNEPDLFGNWRMGGSKDYKNLYYYAASGAAKAKNVKEFKIGGPATTGLYRNWVDNFFPFILKNKLRLDFFSWHRYDLNLSQYVNDVVSVDKWIESHPNFSQVEKIISEMGPQSEAGGRNDTLMGAAHLVAVSRELMGKVRYGFNFAITGDWGIVGKPRQTALEFLSRLGPDRLSLTGEGTWVKAIGARSNGRYQVVLTNYDPKGVHYETVPISFLGLKENKFTLKRQFLGQSITETEVATSEAILQTVIPMPANSVVWLELTPKN